MLPAFEQFPTCGDHRKYPWHSYDYDFDSLNITLPHYLDAPAPFSFGIADLVTAGYPNPHRLNSCIERAPAFAFKGLVTVDSVSEEERHGSLCHKCSVDGAGFERCVGRMWVDKSARHIVDYEIDLPEEPGY